MSTPSDLSRRGFLTPWRRAAAALGGANARVAAPAGIGEPDEPEPPPAPSVPVEALRTHLTPLPPASTARGVVRCPDTPAGPAVAGIAAIAVLDPARCTAHRGLPCRTCFELCPVPGALVMVRGGRGHVPVAGPADCTGCGLCEQHCPADGAIRLVARDGGGPARVRIGA